MQTIHSFQYFYNILCLIHFSNRRSRSYTSPEEELPPVAPPPLLASVLSATSVTFPALSTFEVVSFATSLLPAGVVTVTACVVSFFTVTSALSDVVSTLLPSAPLVRFSVIGAAAFTLPVYWKLHLHLPLFHLR